MNKALAERTEKPGEWKRNGFVWMIIAGPAIVVVAALVTAWIAWDGADPVLEEQYRRSQSGAQPAEMAPMLPAMKARNHAATPDAHLPVAPPKSH
jgi:uncharacterized protein